MDRGYGGAVLRSESAMRILMVDDHELVRRGIRSVLATEPTFTVRDEAVAMAGMPWKKPGHCTLTSSS